MVLPVFFQKKKKEKKNSCKIFFKGIQTVIEIFQKDKNIVVCVKQDGF